VNDADAADLLEELVRLESPSRHEARAVAFFVEALSGLGFDAHEDPAGNAVGVLGDGPRLALLGHIDTVPGVVPVRREAGRLFGRGAVDAKGSLVAFTAAAARAAAAGTLGWRVELVACVEEEVASSKGAHYRATLPAPEACIVGEPSGWQGVTLGYKGFLRARLARTLPVGHTAGEEPGAAARACRAFVELEEAARRRDGAGAALFDRVLLHLADVRVAGDHLHETAELDLRLRLPPELPPQPAAAWLREHAPGWDVRVEGGLPAWSGPRTGGLARRFTRAIAAAGGRARPQRKTGTADLNVVAPAWGCDAVAYGPGDSSLDHAPDEHLELGELARAIDVLGTVLTGAQ